MKTLVMGGEGGRGESLYSRGKGRGEFFIEEGRRAPVRQPIHSQSRASRLNESSTQHIIASANAQMLKMLHAAREGRIRESKSRMFRPEFPPSRIEK